LEFLGEMRYRAEAVTAFLAALELIRLGVVRALQPAPSGRSTSAARKFRSPPIRCVILTGEEEVASPQFSVQTRRTFTVLSSQFKHGELRTDN